MCVCSSIDHVQLAIARLRPQLIISGETDFHVADSIGKFFPSVEARVLKEDGSEADGAWRIVRPEWDCRFGLLEQRESNARVIP